MAATKTNPFFGWIHRYEVSEMKIVTANLVLSQTGKVPPGIQCFILTKTLRKGHRANGEKSPNPVIGVS